jgi:hypothetical protein
MAEPSESTPFVDDAQPSTERARMILTELVNAAQAAALSVVDEQKVRSTTQLGGLAAALHAAAGELERSQSPMAAHYTETAAQQIGELAAALRKRSLNRLIADLEAAARRRPAAFVAGAVAVGFIIGRFLSAAARREAAASSIAAVPSPEGTVAAAVASGPGNGELTDWPPSSSEARELS